MWYQAQSRGFLVFTPKLFCVLIQTHFIVAGEGFEPTTSGL